jgi:hypothetical protein
MLDATGGAPGDDLQHAVIRRWTAPCDGRIAIRGKVRLLYDADVYQGSIRVRIVSSRSGECFRSAVGRGEVATSVDAIEAKRGDTIDFVAECPDHVAYSRFGWAPEIAMKDHAWSAETEFAGPPEAPLTAWESYAQALLMSNEFLFVD